MSAELNILLISFFFFALIFHGTGTVSFPLFFQLLAVTLICATTGSVFLKTLRINRLPCRNLLTIVVGFIASSLFINAVSHLAGISALHSFYYLSILVLLPAIFLYPHSFRENLAYSHHDVYDYCVLLGMLLFIFIWSWDASSGFYALKTTNILHAWEDYYFHGVQIAQFSDPKAVGQGDILLAGMPLTFYHRCIYMIPAVIAEIANLPGVSASTTLLLPLGILLLCISAYTLATQLSGRIAGIIALICILVLPDSSLYWFKNGFLGFHYSLRVAAGTGFGIAVCLASMIFFIQGTRDNIKGLWVVSILLAISCFFFRVHMFVLYFPVFIFMLMLHFYFDRKWFQYSLFFASASFLLLSLLAYFNHGMRAFYLEKSAVLPFLDLVHLQRGETAYSSMFKNIIEMHKPTITIVTGVGLLLSAILSGWLFLYPLALYFKIKDIGYKRIDTFPLAIFMFYVFIVLTFPTVHGLPDEWQHRPFGLLYALIIIFTVAYSVEFFNSRQKTMPYLARYTPTLIIIISMLGVFTACISPNTRYIRKIFTGASLYGEYNLSANAHVIKSAVYLREKAIRGDVFLISNVEDTGGSLVDSGIVIASISGVPAYAANFALAKMPDFVKSDVIDERSSFMQSVANAASMKQASSLLRGKGITWYIALSPQRWDSTEKYVAFKSGDVAVYHILET